MFEPEPNTVVAIFRSRLVGKDSGVALEQQFAAVCVLSEGKLLRFDTYLSPAEALEAVGLGE
jgi:ketosteroid isomerase-like protein